MMFDGDVVYEEFSKFLFKVLWAVNLNVKAMTLATSPKEEDIRIARGSRIGLNEVNHVDLL